MVGVEGIGPGATAARHVQLGRLHVAQGLLDKVAGGDQNPAGASPNSV